GLLEAFGSRPEAGSSKLSAKRTVPACGVYGRLPRAGVLATDSQGKNGPAFGRLTRPSGPLIHVVAPSVNAVQLSTCLQTSSPPLVRCSVSRFTSVPSGRTLPCSFSRQAPTIVGI